MDYIELEWGGAEEQQAQIASGDVGAKNWVEEALKVLETEVCGVLLYIPYHSMHILDGTLLYGWRR